MSYVRVVRFTDVTEDRIAGLRERIDERSGPPEGVTATGVQFNYDADQGTAVVIQKFASMDDLKSSEEALEAMDPEQTPGTRASVDRCEVVAELDA
jgi:hypothetical protein